MRYCTSCGKELRDDARFCPQCGSPTAQDCANPRNSKEKRNKSKKTLKLVGGILLSWGILFGVCAALVHFEVIDIRFAGDRRSTTSPTLHYTIPDYLWDDNAQDGGKQETEATVPSEAPLPEAEPTEVQWVYEDLVLSAGNYHSVYLAPDGTVAAKGSSKKSEYANRGLRCDVSGWTDIVQVSAASHTVGVKSDGTVVAVGVNRYGQCNLDGWKDIAAVSAGDDCTLGLRSNGTVIAKGNRETGQCDVSGWTDIVQVAAGATTSYGLKSNGKVVAAGANGTGQRDVSAWSNIKAISAANLYVAGLKENGTVVVAGKLSDADNESWKEEYTAWTDIVAISASSTHLVGLRSDGTVVSCGRNDYGELDTESWTDIVAISAGMHFTLGMQSDGTLVAVGSNAFGQLDIVDYT